MPTYLIHAADLAILLAGLYLAYVAWREHHPRYPVCPDDGLQTEMADQDDYLGIGS